MSRIENWSKKKDRNNVEEWQNTKLPRYRAGIAKRGDDWRWYVNSGSDSVQNTVVDTKKKAKNRVLRWMRNNPVPSTWP